MERTKIDERIRKFKERHRDIRILILAVGIFIGLGLSIFLNPEYDVAFRYKPNMIEMRDVLGDNVHIYQINDTTTIIRHPKITIRTDVSSYKRN